MLMSVTGSNRINAKVYSPFLGSAAGLSGAFWSSFCLEVGEIGGLVFATGFNPNFAAAILKNKSTNLTQNTGEKKLVDYSSTQEYVISPKQTLLIALFNYHNTCTSASYSQQ